MRISVAWALGCALLAFAPAARAQTQITTGAIQGMALDEAAALVPGAGVEVRNLETNFTQTLSTDANGRFVFLQLPSGRYTLTISKPGYATVVQENLTLTVGQTITLIMNMKVSQVTERITITDAPTIDLVKTESSTTLNDVAVGNTPILGRKFEDLLTLTPGVSIVQGPDGDEITFAGQRGIFNNISLDGGDYNNGFFAEQVGGQRAAVDITLEAVKEFQVVATGASAEFGRTAGGVVNVITKSGTNEFRGNIFHYQRLEALSSDTSDGKPLTDFHREQFGATLGGPIIKDRMFFFAAVEQITGNLQRPNLSEPLGPACPVAAPTITANEALINGSAECQRVALLNFFRTTRGQEEGRPVRRPVHNTAVLGKWDWKVTPTNQASLSYNFNRSNKLNDTFDVPTYGNSANGNEGPSRIQVANFNLYSTISPTMLNEAHFTYSRENRPRAAAASNVAADTAMGFATTFRFGNPYFIQPGVDEIFWRTQVKDNISVVSANHTIKAGGEWIHSRNVQVFRGFFTGRYIFDSVTGFLRYASSPALGPGYGPRASGCPDGSYVDAAAPCPGGATKTGGPLLFYSQGAGLDGPATDAAGASDFANDEFALFAQDKWQARSNLTLNYGLRWEAQILPKPFISPALTAYGQFIGDPRFPSTGYLPSQRKMFQPRLGFAWDILKNSRSVLRANWGIYNARQNMISQVGSLTTNGVQQQSIFVNTTIIGFGVTPPVWPNVVSPPPVPPGTFPAGSGVRVFSRDYANPRVYTANVAFEQELFGGLVAYLDATWSKGVHLTRFINVNNGSGPAVVPQEGNTVIYTGPPPFGPQLGEVMVASSSAKSLYRGFTAGARRRFSRGFQLEGNYVWSKDLDDDSNERDPFTDRSFNRFDFSKDYAYSDRDIRHKFNFYAYAELPLGFQASARIQARSAQPITPTPRVFNGFDRGRNSTRKDNEYFSLDWRAQRPIRFGDRFALIPVVEMFNTTNSKNNINPLVTPALFNFDGYLRQGVGDPRQLQLAVKFTF